MKFIKTHPDGAVVLVYAILLLIGIWYGFPNLKVVADEAPFVGGVLRAIENKTLWPDIDYSYTVSFFANYLLMVPFIGLIFVITGSTVSAVSFLMEHVYLAYFIPRIVSVVSALFTLHYFLKFMKKRGRDLYERIILSSIVFGNIIFLVIAHTGKMWALSLFLWFLSFYLFDKALNDGDSKSFFWCVLVSFLAFANFPVNLIALIFPLYLWREALKKKIYSKALIWGTICGLVMFGVLFLVNYDGWIMQNSVTPIEGGSALGILKYFISGALVLIPMHVLYIFCVRKFPEDKARWVLWFSLSAYIVIVATRAPWIGGSSPETYWRYFVYIGFMLGLVLATHHLRYRKLPLFLAAVSLIFAFKTTYLLAVPSTHNLARDYLSINSENSLVVNMYPYLDLPKDQASYSVVEDDLCQSRCLYGRSNSTPMTSLFVIDSETKSDQFERIIREEKIYWLVSLSERENLPLVQVVGHDINNSRFREVDYNLGPYSLSLLSLERLGPTIYIYRK